MSEVDGATRSLVYTHNQGGSWIDLAGHPLTVNGSAEQYTAANGLSPIAGKNFRFPMTITAALNKGSALQVAQDTPLNGQAVFTINYE